MTIRKTWIAMCRNPEILKQGAEKSVLSGRNRASCTHSETPNHLHRKFRGQLGDTAQACGLTFFCFLHTMKQGTGPEPCVRQMVPGDVS
jgi:hypothetical protein